MANDDTELELASLEKTPLRAGRIGTLLRRVDLDFVLEPRDRSVPIDDQCGDPDRTIHDALRTENDHEICFRRRRCHDGPCTLKECRIGRRHLVPQ